MESGFSGVAVISPFACLPGRVVKAFLEPYCRERKYPVIALENDGITYPPSILNKLDIFALNVKRFKEDLVKKGVSSD